jgi:hypothetical protein
LRTVKAFLKGYKPAFLEIPGTEFTTKKLDLLLAKYPYVDEKQYDVLNGNRFYLFFQDEVILEQFQEKINSISFTKEEIDCVLGTILGFPPKAINFYVQMWKEKIRGNLKGFEQMQNRKIGIIYCGCCFVSDVTDFQENVLWLLEKYPYEEAKLDGMFIRIGDERIQVPIGDIRQIRDFHEYIMHHVGVVPA